MSQHAEPLVRELKNPNHARHHAHATELEGVPERQRSSARNLLHYLALRQHDLRELQPVLADIGLSSLGRCEASTLATLDAVLAALRRLADHPRGGSDMPPPVDLSSGPRALRRSTESLLGTRPEG